MSNVAIVRSNEEKAETSIKKLFHLLGGIEKFINKGDKVLLKPNFIAPKKSSTGTTTDLHVIEAVIKAVKAIGAEPIIAEGVPFAYDANNIFKILGIEKIAKKHNIKLINLDNYQPHNYTIKNATTLKTAIISKLIFDVDKIINLPTMKTHMLTTVTLGMKNLKGCLVGKEKLRPHSLGVSESVVDLNTLIKPTLTIIDGIIAMEGQGPTSGTPKRMNLLLASDDILALEIITSKIMGFDPYKIEHIKQSKHRNIGEYDIKKVTVLGENIDTIQTKFKYPKNRIERITSNFLLGYVCPFLLKLGIDIKKHYSNFSTFFMPYPKMLNKCTGCSKCIINCPTKAIKYQGKKNPIIDNSKCIKCYVCDEVCIYENIKIKK